MSEPVPYGEGHINQTYALTVTSAQGAKRYILQKINTDTFKGGHFAAFPPKLAETCILAGCPKGGIVLDPFFGSGTTGLAAKSLDRHYIGIELNYDYCTLARARIGGETN